jgi:hypothetical protein
VRALEIGYAASANTLYIFRNILYILFILQYKKSIKAPQNCLKKAENVVLIVFDGILCDVHDYTIAVSYGRLT